MGVSALIGMEIIDFIQLPPDISKASPRRNSRFFIFSILISDTFIKFSCNSVCNKTPHSVGLLIIGRKLFSYQYGRRTFAKD